MEITDYSSLLPGTANKGFNPEKPEGQIPMKVDGLPEGAIPKTMILGFGKQGIPKGKQFGSRFDFYISTRERFVLRKRHPILAAAHNAVLKAVKKVELYVSIIDQSKPFDKGTKARMENFAQNGFGSSGEKEFRVKLVDTKKWNGDAFSEIVFDAATKEPKLVNYLMAETMWILPNEYGQIIGYPQVIDGSLNYTFPPENMIHLKEHEDEYSFFGYSDLDAIYVPLLTDSLSDEFNMEFLKNYAMPSGVLAFDDDVADTDLLRLRWQFIIQHQQQPNKPIFLNHIKQWLPMAVETKDMNWSQMRRDIRERVFSIYGVLPMQAAIVESGKLANPEQQLEIGSEYIRQEMQTLENCYNMKLTPHFKNSENLMFKFGDVDPKPDEERKEAETAKIKADTAKVLSTIPNTYKIDEIREIAGHDPLDAGGDEFIQSYSPSTPFFSEMDSSQATCARKDAKPFAGYENFAECVEQNQDKDNPESYCAAIMQEVEGSNYSGEQKTLTIFKMSRIERRRKFAAELGKIHAKFSRQAIKEAKQRYEPPQKGARYDKKTLGVFEAALAVLVGKLKDEMDNNAKRNATNTFKDAKTALGGTFSKPDEKAILALLNANGGALSAIKGFTSAQKEGFVQVMKNAFEEGLDLRAMTKEMQSFADIEIYKLERIARTETNRFANQGRFAGYKELEERRGEEYNYEWIGPQDERTSFLCEDIKAGNPYTLEGLMRATDGGEPHPNCRHSIVRLVK